MAVSSGAVGADRGVRAGGGGVRSAAAVSGHRRGCLFRGGAGAARGPGGAAVLAEDAARQGHGAGASPAEEAPGQGRRLRHVPGLPDLARLRSRGGSGVSEPEGVFRDVGHNSREMEAGVPGGRARPRREEGRKEGGRKVGRPARDKGRRRARRSSSCACSSGSSVLSIRGLVPGSAGRAPTACSNGVTGSSPPSAWSRCSRAEGGRKRSERRPPGRFFHSTSHFLEVPGKGTALGLSPRTAAPTFLVALGPPSEGSTVTRSAGYRLRTGPSPARDRPARPPPTSARTPPPSRRGCTPSTSQCAGSWPTRRVEIERRSLSGHFRRRLMLLGTSCPATSG